MTSNLIDTTAAIAQLIDNITNLPISPPSLFIDLEGINLSRNGSLSLIQLLANPQNHTYLIDVHVLGNAVFTTPGIRNGMTTLKNIFESAHTPKIFFDVRNDSDTLFAHFGIALQGVQDVQLMENASRPGRLYGKRLLAGLASCIEKDAPIGLQEKQAFKAGKEAGARLFDPRKGGAYEVFNKRPLDEVVKAYCVQDVRFLPMLREVYWNRLTVQWKGKVEVETEIRVTNSQGVGYQPHGREKALGPWK
ncbi:MAG: hypothetical protein Q9164_003946 [Protoblastenia rupestris]